MNDVLAKNLQKLANKFGYAIFSTKVYGLTDKEYDTIKSVRDYTMLDQSNICALIDSVQYLIKNNVEGCFVECGIWKGGAVMTMIKTLQNLGINNKEFYLYDTFEGMSNPTEFDLTYLKKSATKALDSLVRFTKISLDEARTNILKTGYDKSKIHFFKGKVEDTLPKNSPDKIALLRLDTDFYESTKAELEYLFPKLSKGGIVIIDDYAFWLGSRKATDEYLEKNKIQIHLHRLPPYGTRVGVKM